MQTREQAKVLIIIVNWNGLKDTIECLESIKKIDYHSYEIIVVDNASTDGSPAFIEQRFPDVILLKNEENLGFSGGSNEGIRFALIRGAEYIFLLKAPSNNRPIFD